MSFCAKKRQIRSISVTEEATILKFTSGGRLRLKSLDVVEILALKEGETVKFKLTGDGRLKWIGKNGKKLWSL